MSLITDLGTEIAGLWRRECEAEDAALRAGDPILRSNHKETAAALCAERKTLQESIGRNPATTAKETLILALIAADFFAELDAGRTIRNTPLRHLHNGIIAALEIQADITRDEMGLGFLWISDHDGPVDA